jgi:glycosyltransferase involved in cell wall biosynthesis
MNDTPLQVLHVISQLAGGRGHLLANAAPFWTANGIQPVIMTAGAVLPALRSALEAARIPIIPPSDSGRYDIVHLHDRQTLAQQARQVRRWHQGPIVATIHGCGSPPSFRTRLVNGVTRHWARNGLGVVFVAVSPDVQAAEKKNYALSCRTIPNWTQPDRFMPPEPALRLARRREWAIPDGQPVIVTVANCAPAKRHVLILEALAALRAIRPSFLFLHAGRETDTGERAKAAALGLDAHVRFLGPVNDVPGLLQAADLYLMTSSREGLSLASIEALSCGLPAVFTRSPGFLCLNDFFTGLTFADPTPRDLARSLDSALNALPEFGEAQARSNHETACRLFSPRAGAAAYAALYRELLEPPPAHGGRP